MEHAAVTAAISATPSEVREWLRLKYRNDIPQLRASPGKRVLANLLGDVLSPT